MDNQIPTQQPVQTPESNPVASNPPSHKPSMLFIGIGAIVLFGLGLAGGYILRGNSQTIPSSPSVQQTTQISPEVTRMISPSANPSPTTTAQIDGWKTYTNEANGYSLQYPTDKIERLQCPDEELDLSEKQPGVQSVEGTPLPTCGRDSRFLIEGRTHPANYTLPDLSDNYAFTTEDITLGDKKATLYTYTQTKPFEGQGGPAWFEEVLIHGDNKVYEFYLGNEKFKMLFANILTTIKFTN